MKISLTTEYPDLNKFADGIRSMNYHVEHIGDNLDMETTAVSIVQDGEEITVKLTLRPKVADRNGLTPDSPEGLSEGERTSWLSLTQEQREALAGFEMQNTADRPF